MAPLSPNHDTSLRPCGNQPHPGRRPGSLSTHSLTDNHQPRHRTTDQPSSYRSCSVLARISATPGSPDYPLAASWPPPSWPCLKLPPRGGHLRLSTTTKFNLSSHLYPWKTSSLPFHSTRASMGLLANHNIQDKHTP
jgi:hypothetical protein